MERKGIASEKRGDVGAFFCKARGDETSTDKEDMSVK